MRVRHHAHAEVDVEPCITLSRNNSGHLADIHVTQLDAVRCQTAATQRSLDMVTHTDPDGVQQQGLQLQSPRGPISARIMGVVARVSGTSASTVVAVAAGHAIIDGLLSSPQ